MRIPGATVAPSDSFGGADFCDQKLSVVGPMDSALKPFYPGPIEFLVKLWPNLSAGGGSPSRLSYTGSQFRLGGRLFSGSTISL